jgi:hypothetical protein
MINMDYHVFQIINHFAISDAFLNPIMDFLSQDGEYLFFLGVIIYWFMRTKTNRRMVAEGLVAACVALGLNGVIACYSIEIVLLSIIMSFSLFSMQLMLHSQVIMQQRHLLSLHRFGFGGNGMV